MSPHVCIHGQVEFQVKVVQEPWKLVSIFGSHDAHRLLALFGRTLVLGSLGVLVAFVTSEQPDSGLACNCMDFPFCVL